MKTNLKSCFAGVLTLLLMAWTIPSTAQTPLGPITVSNQNTYDGGGFSSDEDIAINSSRDYAHVWNREVSGGGNLQTVYLRLFNEDGTPLTNDIQVSGLIDRNINGAQVGLDDAGNAYVLYDEKKSSSGTDYNLWLKRYSSSGTLLGSTLVATIDQSCTPDIAVMPNGRSIVAYTSSSDDNILRVYSSSLQQQGQTSYSPGVHYHRHVIDERNGVVALGYSRVNDFHLRKYQVNSNSFTLLAGPVSLNRGFCGDPIALREDGKVALLTCYGSSNPAHYELRNVDLTLNSDLSLPNPDLSSAFCGIDTDVDDNAYILWRTNDTHNGRVYDANNNLSSSFNSGFFSSPSVAAYDCRFVVSSWRVPGNDQMEAVHRRFTCEDCDFNTLFTYKFRCLGDKVEILVSANENYPNSLFNLYQVSVPSTADPLGPIIDQISGNSGIFIVDNQPGTYYVIKHGNWSSECPWRETRVLVAMPTFAEPIDPNFSYQVLSNSGSTVFDLNLSPNYNPGSTAHTWFLSRGPSDSGPWTWVDYAQSLDNTIVTMSNHPKMYYYRILHIAGGDCYAADTESEIIYVDRNGLVSGGGKEEKSASKKSSPQLEARLSLWPNPANDQLSLNWIGISEMENLQVVIYSAQGQKVHAQDLSAGQGRGQVPVSGLSKGLYILALQSGDRILVREKFTIQR